MHTTRQIRSTLLSMSLLAALVAAPTLVLAQAAPAGATQAIRPNTATPAAPAPAQNAVPDVGGNANGNVNVNIKGTIHNDFDSTKPKTIDGGASRIADPSRNNDRLTEPGRDNSGAAATSSSSSAGRAGAAPAATPKRPVSTRDRAQPRRTNIKKPRPTVDESNMASVTPPQPRNQDPAAPSSM